MPHVTEPAVALTLTVRELADLRAAVRAHRRTLAASREDEQTFRANRLALLAPRLTDALDGLQVERG